MSEEGERVARLEVQVSHMETKLGEMGDKVDAMYSLMMQAKGARYVIAATAAIGGAVAGFATKFIPWASGLPR